MVALRAVVPAGFMPDLRPGSDPFALIWCAAGGTASLPSEVQALYDDLAGEDGHGTTAEGSAACDFSLSSHALALGTPNLTALLRLSVSGAEPAPARHQRPAGVWHAPNAPPTGPPAPLTA